MLVISQADGALAARSGGRIGGGSFSRPPSRTYTSPQTRSPSGAYYGGGYYGGGGFGFPFLIPFFGFGGGLGGVLSVLVVIAIANSLIKSFSSVSTRGELEATGSNSVSVAKVQVGLLAQARSLQADLNRMTETADTGSAAGRAQVLQEATLALLRHPEYWAYGAAHVQTQGLEAAETQFNRWTLAERSKFTAETLSNVNNQKLASVAGSAIVPGDETKALSEFVSEPISEYIVVTLVIGATGTLQLPKIATLEAMRQVLSRLGSLSGEQLLAVEILWAPQADDDGLDADDMMTNYPELQLL
ncbi:MAG: DUF1517 domain-containing protein [Microcoleaceae cyanobacterium]